MSYFKDFLRDQLKDPEIHAEWNALQPERTAAQAIIDARQNKELSQEQFRIKSLPADEK